MRDTGIDELDGPLGDGLRRVRLRKDRCRYRARNDARNLDRGRTRAVLQFVRWSF